MIYILVVVIGPPVIQSSSNQYARYAEAASIVCAVIATPTPTAISWAKNGQPIDFVALPR